MADEYPTEDELCEIVTWPIVGAKDCAELLDYVQDIWWAADWGWREAIEEEDVGEARKESYMVYSISTGGWSGNEDIIGAMRQNTMFWVLCWQSSRRGGHYEFRIRQ